MNWKRMAVSLTAGLAGLFLATIPASAQCTVKYSHSAMTSSFVGPFTSWVNLNAEGLTERPSDIVISGVGCFTTDSTLEIQYDAVMSIPTTIGLSDRGQYWDFYDKSDSMSIDTVSVTQPTSSSGLVTKIQIHINLGTVEPTAEVIIKNLRFDVTGTTGTGYQSVGDGSYLNAYVGTTNPSFTAAPFPVGYVLKTVVGGGVTDVGWGFEDGVCPFKLCPYPNQGGTIGYLLHQATWSFLTNTWTTDFPFRYNGESFAPAVNDLLPIGATDLVVDVEDIPSGVTVTFPQHLYICGSDSILDTWTATNSVGPQTGGHLATVYQTTSTSGHGGASLVVTTGMSPSTSVGCPNVIGVQVGNPSGNNADGNMQVDLRVVMGPALKAQFTGDDAQPTAVPRYLNNIAASRPTREIIGDATGNPVQYFYLNPTQTVLLYPFVTSFSGWNTGIEVGNTGNDGAVFGNTGQAGKLDVYFFPTNGTPFEYTVAAGVGRGLDAQGNLEAGGDFADSLTDLVAKAGQPFVEGYIIIVAHFNFGHGAAMVFNTSGAVTAVPALVLGGHCSYDYGYGYDPNAQPPAVNPLQFPACSSARQGDITKLPEQLKQ